LSYKPGTFFRSDLHQFYSKALQGKGRTVYRIGRMRNRRMKDYRIKTF
jgi:hypothetical protein